MDATTPSHGTRNLPVSRRSAAIKAFEVMRVLHAASRLESDSPSTAQKVLHLEAGQPSYAPPSNATAAAISSLRRPASEQGYSSTGGIHALRVSLSEHYSKRYSQHVHPDQIIVTTGSSGAFIALFATLFDVGDRVALALPGYPCYRNVLAALNVDVVPIFVDSHSNYQPTLDQFRAAHKEKPLSGLVLATPSNPTGSVISPTRLSELAEWTREEGIRLIVDEIYHCLVRKPLPSAVAFPHAIIVSSFSKYWCMPGFRVGWAVVRCDETRTALENALQNMHICAPMVSQQAAIGALSAECEAELDEHVQGYFQAADELVEVLKEAGFEEVGKPDGAFYVYVGCEDVCQRVGVTSSVELCRLVLEKVRVAITPGTDFDPVRGGKFVRFSSAGSHEDIAEAGQRILRFLREHGEG